MSWLILLVGSLKLFSSSLQLGLCSFLVPEEYGSNRVHLPLPSDPRTKCKCTWSADQALSRRQDHGIWDRGEDILTLKSFHFPCTAWMIDVTVPLIDEQDLWAQAHVINKCYCMLKKRWRGSATGEGDHHISLCMIIRCQWRAGWCNFAFYYLQLSQTKVYQENCLIPHSDCTALESSILTAWCREGKKKAGIYSELILFLQFW